MHSTNFHFIRKFYVIDFMGFLRKSVIMFGKNLTFYWK